jgi:hypothetical protein
MLDTRNPVVIDEVADVIVYRDDASQTVFYAVPAKPRLALDEQGKPQLSLVAYGKKGPAGFKARGGILTLTTALQLTGAEAEGVSHSLASRLAREFPQPEDVPPLVPELRPIEWVKGSVELQVIPGVVATGRPSLFGGNQFSHSANLDAQTIGAVLEAWERRLPDASISYHLTARTAPGGVSETHSMSYESFSADMGTARTTIDASVRRASSSAAANPDLEFKGPLLPPDADPGQFLQLQTL